MKSSTGRWVTGDNFFDRTDELDQLEALVREGNHVLLTGQRRIGKTSVARELAARLERDRWKVIFTSIEGSRDEEDVITSMASAAHGLIPTWSRLAKQMSRWIGEQTGKIKEIGARDFHVRLRARTTKETWRRQGHELVTACADHSTSVLLVVDELPIFLAKLLQRDHGTERVDGFLTWLREAFQLVERRSPALLVSGSIGLAPLVRRLRIPDRINYLHTVRLGPWSREVSVECLHALAAEYDLRMEDRAADALYDRLGIGIPQHVQSFFARLRHFPATRAKGRVAVADMDAVYRTEMLGPVGQDELSHYETRLREALADETSHEIASTILAETAATGAFAASSRSALERLYSNRVNDVAARISDVLDILVHDGYLEHSTEGHRFLSNWLKDWWSMRSRDCYVTLERRRIGY